MSAKSFFRKSLKKRNKKTVIRSGNFGKKPIHRNKKLKLKNDLLMGVSGRNKTRWPAALSISQKPLLFTIRIIVGSLCIILTSCSLASPFPSSVPTATPSRPVYKIDTSPIAKGILVPQKVIQLSFDTTGRIQEIYVKVGDVVDAGEILMRLETVGLEADVAYAENALLAAQAELEYQKMYIGRAAQIAIASARVNMAEADLTHARYLLQQATLTAPSYGTVVTLDAEIGEIVTPGDAIITIADLNSLQVRTLDLDEFSIPQIFVGQRTINHIEALDVDVGGKVVTIAPQSTLVGERSTYEVIIELDSHPDGLRWGMSVNVKFEENLQ